MLKTENWLVSIYQFLSLVVQLASQLTSQFASQFM